MAEEPSGGNGDEARKPFDATVDASRDEVKDAPKDDRSEGCGVTAAKGGPSDAVAEPKMLATEQSVFAEPKARAKDPLESAIVMKPQERGPAKSKQDSSGPSAPSSVKSSSNSTPNSSALDFSVPTLKHFATFTRVTSVLEGYIVAAMRENRRLDHILIHGNAGSGTTTLARALVRDYAPNRFEELDALSCISFQKLKRALARANRRGVVLIRHVELLDAASMSYLSAYMSGKPMEPEVRPDMGAFRAPNETELDREIAASARSNPNTDPGRERFTPGGTVIATALMPSHLHYSLRSRFEQLIGLRNDPKALRVALTRVLRPHGISITADAFPRAERLLGSLTESTEQLARTVLARAQLDEAQTIDDTLMKSIIEEDLADRVPISHYAASLREHLGGRKVKEASCEEVHRIADETAWGTSVVRSAITAMIRENRAVQRTERPQSPM